MRCAECGKRFKTAEKICTDDEETICMNCLEDRIWMKHGIEEIAESLGYKIEKYKRIEKPVIPVPIQLIPGQMDIWGCTE